MTEKVMICGIPFSVVECDDKFNSETTHFGAVKYDKAEIKINKDLHEAVKEETLCHEILHAMLIMIGRDDLSGDEVFVQSLGIAINQTFKIKEQ